eukprot:CAMPEP_0115064822 /NCGR_PEP_ID=MMETSP0227-20121206/9908_1 /TAXON_ID=89957 /ORGANISM="Polarella glacialis, Strain CCMP 1383" /LENGTH=38 /DNA_ID= /DNA_START= /DNA_END= /DNA_ORIENTATION=
MALRMKMKMDGNIIIIKKSIVMPQRSWTETSMASEKTE